MKNDNIIIKRVIQRCGCDMVLPLTLVYVFYIILHGHLSPGGGFSGGAERSGWPCGGDRISPGKNFFQQGA